MSPLFSRRTVTPGMAAASLASAPSCACLALPASACWNTGRATARAVSAFCLARSALTFAAVQAA